MSCDSCGADLRSCKNCRFYSPGAVHDCAERSEELVKDKERANFCDQFQLNPGYKIDHPAGKSGEGGSARNDSRSAFDNLFK